MRSIHQGSLFWPGIIVLDGMQDAAPGRADLPDDLPAVVRRQPLAQEPLAVEVLLEPAVLRIGVIAIRDLRLVPAVVVRQPHPMHQPSAEGSDPLGLVDGVEQPRAILLGDEGTYGAQLAKPLPLPELLD